MNGSLKLFGAHALTSKLCELGVEVSTNFRFRWEWSAGSELFIVYSEDRDTDPLAPDRMTELRNRGLVVKVNRLLQL